MAQLWTSQLPDAQLFRDAFDASPIGIAVENLNGQPLFLNPAFCKFIGFTKKELRSKHCVDFSPAEDAEKDWALFQQLKAGSIDHYQLDKRYFRRDGTLVWGRLSVSLLDSRTSPLVLAMVEDITERKRAEEALTDSEIKFRSVFRDTGVAKVIVSPEGRFLAANKAFCNIIGYSEDELFEKTIESVIFPEDWPSFSNKLHEALRERRGFQWVEQRCLHKSGRVVLTESSTSLILGRENNPQYFVAEVLDVTKRKRAEEALRRSEERLRLAAQAAKMYSFEWDVTTDAVMRSPEHIDILGVKEPLSLTHQQFVERIHPDDRPQFLVSIAGLTPEKPSSVFSYRLCSPDGTFVWLRASGRAFFDDDGKMLRVVGMVADVTNHKVAEEALRASEGRLRLAQQAARIATFQRDLRTGIITWAEGLDSLYGLPPGSLHGKTIAFFKDLLHPDDWEQAQSAIEKGLQTGQPTDAEWRAIWPDGTVHWIASRWQVLIDPSGERSRVVGVNMDVTERKLAEQRLREYERAVEGSGEMIVVVDREYRYLIANSQFLSMRNMTREQVVGRSVLELMTRPEAFADVVKAKLDECFQGNIVRYEMKYPYPGIGERDLLVSYFPIEGESGIDRATCILQDITDRKRAEQTLAEMSRKLLEAQEQERTRIGRELHDDIGQRLALLALDLQKLENNPSQTRTRARKIRNELDEVSSDIEALSHELHSSKLQYLGVIAGIRNWCREVAERQRLEVDFRDNVFSPIPYNAGLGLFRVLQEAIHNAVKHSGVKRVEIEIREHGSAIHMTIRDPGRGFDVETATQGRGLGLTSMKERVRLINGTISIESKPQHGTIIRVRVPLTSERDLGRASG